MSDRVIAFLWPEADFRATGLEVPAGFTIRFGRAAVRAEAEAACDDADYIVTASGMGMIDAALLGLAPRARLVQLTGAGYDNVDHAECARRGIPVCHVPGLNAPSVAQLVVQLALRLKRPLRLLESGGEEEWLAARAVNVMGEEVSGRAGVVGYGNVGRHIARLFLGLGLEVVRAERAGQDDPAVRALPLDELLASSGIVAVALPASADTRGLIDAARIARIRPGAVLIHVGRGGVVDDRAVARALAEGRLAGAAFDVFESEPLPVDHPFLALPEQARARLLLTPHIGGQTLQSKARNFGIALNNVRRIERGEEPIYRTPLSAG
jgi:(S)-sulfolactate dehydrogenase